MKKIFLLGLFLIGSLLKAETPTLLYKHFEYDNSSAGEIELVPADPKHIIVVVKWNIAASKTQGIYLHHQAKIHKLNIIGYSTTGKLTKNDILFYPWFDFDDPVSLYVDGNSENIIVDVWYRLYSKEVL